MLRVSRDSQNSCRAPRALFINPLHLENDAKTSCFICFSCCLLSYFVLSVFLLLIFVFVHSFVFLLKT